MAHPLLGNTPGDTHLLIGNETIVRSAVEAGVQVVSCSPCPPSQEVPDTFYRISPEVAGGATPAGAMTICTTKNVATDPLVTPCHTGALYAAGELPFGPETLESAIKAKLPEIIQAVNLKALELGVKVLDA